MHSVAFGLELRIPPEDSPTHTTTRVPDALTQIFCETPCSPLPTSLLGVTIHEEPGSMSMR